jgi:acetylornithine deacetylase
MDSIIDRLTTMVSAERLRDLTLDLVRIPSPTGQSVQVSEFYAETVRGLGLPVEMVLDYPDSPSTIARYGHLPGAPTLTLDGHLDTIHAAHPEPYADDTRIYGRGTGDMKSGVAAIIEATRILIESGIKLKGNLTLVTHSLHEAPVGHMEGLKALVARGDVFTHAAIVAESGFDSLNVAAKGQAIFEIDIKRQGEVLHENVARPRGIPNPLDHAVALAAAIIDRHMAGAGAAHPLLGPETYFLGQIHGGDFYNRMPTEAQVNGIHRFWPDKDWNDIHATFRDILDSVPLPQGLGRDLRLFGNGLGYEVAPDSGIAQALRAGYQHIVGRDLPLTGSLSVCDANVIAREANIPVVCHGTGSTTGHADLEWVEIADIVRTTRVFLATIVNYLGIE